MDRLIALSLLLCSCALFVPAEKQEDSGVYFHCPWASSVQLVGDWNQWGALTGSVGTVDPRCGLMEKDGDIWRGSLPDDLGRGRYRYAFLINGVELQHDPLNPEQTVFRDKRVSLLIVD